MGRSIYLTAFCICLALFGNAQQHPANRPPVQQVSSIKNLGDSISINQMVIITNENLGPFIHYLQNSSIKLFGKPGEIPVFIKSFLEQFSHDKFTMASPGKDWNCCCTPNNSLPNRQLICQGNDGHLFLLSYLTGGFGEINHLVLIKYTGNTITDFWTGTLWKNLKNKDAIIKYLLANKKKHWGLNGNIIRI